MIAVLNNIGFSLLAGVFVFFVGSFKLKEENYNTHVRWEPKFTPIRIGTCILISFAIFLTNL